jgi:hypothetical protein
LGNILCLESFQAEVVDSFLADLRERATNPGKDIPGIPSSLAAGTSSAERYINRVVQEEVAWLSSRREGTGERHRGLLISAIKLASLRLSEWLPPAARQTIDPYSILLPAAQSNGYISKYGEDVARRTIADGIAYATPRPEPEEWDPGRQPSRGNSHQLIQHPRCRKGHRPLPTIEVPL